MPMSAYVAGLRAKVGTDLLVMPSVSMALFDADGRLLVAQEGGTGLWMTIGGAIDPGETPADAAVREFFEETGLSVAPVRIMGVFGGPDFLVTYANGDAVTYVSTLFEVRRLGGSLRPDDDETIALRFVTAAEAAGLPMSRLSRTLVEAAFARRPEPVFAPPTWRREDR